jgi:hypothetical protein
MAEKERPADIFTRFSETARKLKKQREAMEAGDPAVGKPVVGPNDADEVLKRGYFKEEDEE